MLSLGIDCHSCLWYCLPFSLLVLMVCNMHFCCIQDSIWSCVPWNEVYVLMCKCRGCGIIEKACTVPMVPAYLEQVSSTMGGRGAWRGHHGLEGGNWERKERIRHRGEWEVGGQVLKICPTIFLNLSHFWCSSERPHSAVCSVIHEQTTYSIR